MTVSVLRASKHLCKESDWKYTHLELQKILYIAHVFHFGTENEPLVFGHFEAWDFGMVHPELYQQLKVFGASPILESFPSFLEIDDLQNGSERVCIEAVRDVFPPGSGPRLVAFNHQIGSAWEKFYDPGRLHNVIPNDAILEEYQMYQSHATQNERA